MTTPERVRALTRRERVGLAGLGLTRPTLRPLDTGWGPRVGLYLVTDDDRRVVLKRIEPAGTVTSRLARRVSMRREIAAYRALERRRWEHLHHPALLATDGRTYLVVAYVEAAPRWPPDLRDRVVRALIEFQTGLADAGGHPSVSPLLRSRAPWRTLLHATLGQLRRGSWSLALRFVGTAAGGYISIIRASVPRCAQHGDATFGNVIVQGDGGIHLVDLERVRFSERLHFCDIVQLAVDPQAEDGFDPTTLRVYADAWCRHYHRPAADAHTQLRLAVLLHVLYVLHGYRASPELRRTYRRFLDTVLSPSRFRAWAAGHPASDPGTMTEAPQDT